MPYSVDKNNNLVVKRKGKKLVPKGRFKVKNNSLTYWLNEPSPWKKEYCMPSRISFVGKWRLTSDHSLEFLVDEQPRERLRFKGEIVSVGENVLAFEIVSRDRRGQTHIQLFKLKGVWKLDELNRICFYVTAKKNPSVLLFTQEWQINGRQRISYQYEITELKTKVKRKQELEFKGHWDISQKNRLTYILSGANDSRFDFRAQIEEPILPLREGVIRYRIGVGVSKPARAQEKTISLYGEWKKEKRFGLVFEMQYGKGEIRKIEFGIQVCLVNKHEAVVSLFNQEGSEVGIRLLVQRVSFKKYAIQEFLRIQGSREEVKLEAGVRVPW
jgi:hypothetical protein